MTGQPQVPVSTAGPLAVETQSVLDALEAPTCVVGWDGVIVAVNDAWREFGARHGGPSSGCGPGASYLEACDRAGRSEAAGIDVSEPGDGEDARVVAEALRAVLAGTAGPFARAYPCHSPDTERWFAVRIAPLATSTGSGALITHSDVSRLHEAQSALVHQSLHDVLTGLPNRALLTDRLGQALAEGARLGTHLGVASLDLDHFKRVNDGFGHAAGDALLVAVAERLYASLREGDTLARYSGDGFVVLWRGLAQARDVEVLSTRLAQALEEPFDQDGTVVHLRASIGVTVAQPGESAGDVLLSADAALYDAKRRGRGRTRLFSSELRSGTDGPMATEVALRSALSRSELVLHYQPVIDLATGRAVAVEALARWQHPDRGLLGPEEFIPAAETSGLILPLGRWALTQACRDAADFGGRARGFDVSVNLSARQLIHSDVLRHVRDALGRSGLDPRRLVLEVTESAVVEDEQAAAVALEELAALGVRLAIDDFGTGWSSLLYLRRYPISTLKLDRAFVSGLGRSRDDEAICSSVVSLARAVGATSVAEGVETMEQYAALRDYGCQQAQGFLWSRAVPRDGLEAALSSVERVPAPTQPRSTTPARRTTEVTGYRPDAHVVARLAELQRSGASLHTMAGALNTEQVPSPTGVRWTAAAVARALAAGPG